MEPGKWKWNKPSGNCKTNAVLRCNGHVDCGFLMKAQLEMDGFRLYEMGCEKISVFTLMCSTCLFIGILTGGEPMLFRLPASRVVHILCGEYRLLTDNLNMVYHLWFHRETIIHVTPPQLLLFVKQSSASVSTVTVLFTTNAEEITNFKNLSFAFGSRNSLLSGRNPVVQSTGFSL